MTKKKILWVTSTFPLNEGDVEVPWMVAQIQHLQPYYDITVMSPRYKGKGNELVHNIPVIRWPYAMPKNEDLTHGAGMPTKLKNPFKWPIFGLYLLHGRRTAKTHMDKFDMIFINWPLPHTWFFPKTKTPIVNKYFTAEYTIGKKFPNLLRDSKNKAEHNIYISSYAKKQFEEITGEGLGSNTSVIPELPLIKPVERIEHEGFNVLFVGRNVERKGLPYLIHAAYGLPDVEFHIVGKGTYELKERYDLTPNIHCWDVVSEEQLRTLYSVADVFILPAIIDRKGDTEGQGVVLLEAMFNYIPVVATNVGGIPEIVKHNETGLLIPEKDSGAIVNAITQLKESRELRKRLTEHAREWLFENYTWNIVVKQYREIFDKVMKNHL